MSDASFTHISIPGCPALTVVRFYEETMDHIAEQHPQQFAMQLPSHREGLIAGIANPLSVHESTSAPGKSAVLVSDRFTMNGQNLVVPVRFVEGTSARVQTAYFTSDPYPGRILWAADL